MNIYSDKLFEKYINCDFYYELSPEEKTESAYLLFNNKNADEERFTAPGKKFVLVSEESALSSWISLFGYENNEEDVKKHYNKLKDILSVLSINDDDNTEELFVWVNNLTREKIYYMALRIFDMLQPLISQYPLLAFIYSICYKLLSHCLLLLDNGKVKRDSDYDFISILVTQLFDSINYFEEVYIATRNYSNAVFMAENKPGAKLSPKTVSFIYDQFCEESGTINYAKRPILRFSSPTITFKEKYGLPSSDSWIAYFRSQKNALILDKDSYTLPIFSIEDLGKKGINYLLESDSVLRFCKLCGKAFRAKYTTSQEYCTRLYSDTKAPCNEYASRKSYKEKLFKHPVHQEYTKAYNKVYGRIRRGKLPQDTPLLAQLKELRDEYLDKYESTHRKERERVWKEYIRKNKELLS